MTGAVEAIVTYSILAAMLYSYALSRISSLSELKREIARKRTADYKE
ncbi:MAG: hypothetical protein ACPG9Q_04350 [Candidatus Thalassarchaeaceae archaeon]|tara:strand:+ start:328 stop:468 length:141 start_codon:yes stop_codon:yes gene_type:complete